METIVAFAQALAKIASSRFATALAGGLIGYFAAGRGERATLREQRRKREREIQAAFRALVIEMLRTAELALNGSSVVRTWGDPATKTEEQLEATARAYEGKIPFTSAKYFRDRIWLKYEDIFLENLDSATIYTVDTAYNGARLTFDTMGLPVPEGATRLNLG
jgi:hypothetical protein